MFSVLMKQFTEVLHVRTSRRNCDWRAQDYSPLEFLDTLVILPRFKSTGRWCSCTTRKRAKATYLHVPIAFNVRPLPCLKYRWKFSVQNTT